MNREDLTITDIVKEVKRELGLTWADIAKALEMKTQSAINRASRGAMELSDLCKILALCDGGDINLSKWDNRYILNVHYFIAGKESDREYIWIE